MSYFENFPLVAYPIAGNNLAVTDILRRSKFISEYRPYTDLYDAYTIMDGDTPQSLALKFYGATTYHWVVLMFNEIHNMYTDWPLGVLALERVAGAKYGSDLYETAYFKDSDGHIIGEVADYYSGWVPPTNPGQFLAVSWYDHEVDLNESRRTIRILRPELLGEFVRQFGVSIRG